MTTTFAPMKGGGKVSLPSKIVPKANGRPLPTEHLKYVNAAEAHMLKLLSGPANKTKFGPQSFAPDGGDDGNGGDGYGNDGGSLGRSGYSGSGSGSGNSSSGGGGRPDGGQDNSGGMGGQGPMGGGYGGGSGAQGGGGQNSGGYSPGNRPDGGNDNNGGYGYGNNGSPNSGGSGGGNSGLGALGSLLGNSLTPGLGGTSAIAHALSGLLGLGTPNSIKDQSRIAPTNSAAAVTPGVMDPNHVTVNDVPGIPGAPPNAQQMAQAYSQYRSPAGYSGPSQSSLTPATDAGSSQAVQAATQPSAMAQAYSQYQQPPGYSTSRDPSLVGQSLSQTDPRAGYYDPSITTPQTQFADRLREGEQLRGMTPNDNANSGMMGNFAAENLAGYMTPLSNSWDIGSPAANGKFAPVLGFNDNSDTGQTFEASGVPSWHGARADQVGNFFSQSGMNPNDPNAQADAITAEMAGQLPGQTNNYRSLYSSMSGMNIPDATSAFMRGYENPSYNPNVNHIADRQAYADAFSGNLPDYDAKPVQTAMGNAPSIGQQGNYFSGGLPSSAPMQTAMGAPQLSPQSNYFAGGYPSQAGFPNSQIASAGDTPQIPGMYGTVDPTTQLAYNYPTKLGPVAPRNFIGRTVWNGVNTIANAPSNTDVSGYQGAASSNGPLYGRGIDRSNGGNGRGSQGGTNPPSTGGTTPPPSTTPPVNPLGTPWYYPTYSQASWDPNLPSGQLGGYIKQPGSSTTTPTTPAAPTNPRRGQTTTDSSGKMWTWDVRTQKWIQKSSTAKPVGLLGDAA